MAHSGTHLQVSADYPSIVFDATNELSADCLYHVITISGGSGITAGDYFVYAFNVAYNLPADGVHNIATIVKADNTAFSAPGGTGATWSVGPFGTTGGDGTSGNNLISSPGFAAGGGVIDPDSPIDPAMLGKFVHISGTGWTTGDYEIISYTAAAGGFFPNNLFGVIRRSGGVPTNPALYPATAELVTSGTWSIIGGLPIPTVTPNTTFTGAIKVGIWGDSIPHQNDQIIAELTAAFPNASSITVVNAAVDGTTTADWVQGQTAYNNAVAAFNLAGVTVIIGQIGTNNLTDAATWLSNVQNTATGYVADVLTATKHTILEIPSNRLSYLDDADARISSYNAQRTNVGHGTTAGTSEAFTFFQTDYYLLGDGLHPSDPVGRRAMARLWLNNGLMEAIAPSGPDVTPPTVLQTSATNISADGLTLNIAHSEIVSGVDDAVANGDYRLSTLQALGAVTTSDSITYAVACAQVYKAQTPTLQYFDGDGFVIDESGNLLAAFSGQTITNNSTVICAVPVGLTATGYNGKIRIRWTANVEPVLQDYKVYSSSTVNGTYTLVSGGTVLRGTNTLLLTSANDTQVFIKITSRDTGNNESAKSTAVSATPTAAAGNEPSGNGTVFSRAFAFGFNI